MSWPTLNWKETAALVDAIRPALEGLFVDRVVVPTRLEFAEGFVRGEWALRLTGRKSEATHAERPPEKAVPRTGTRQGTSRS